MDHRPKHKPIKLPEDSIENLDDLGIGDDFNTAPKAWFMEDIIDKLDFIKI